MKFPKPATTYEQQADLIVGRGMVADRAILLRRLQSVGYYRLCGYWHPFKQPDDSFETGTTLETVWQRYTFDRQLRLSVMDALERVEVAVRTVLLHELALQFGPFAHIEAKNFPNVRPETHAKFIDSLQAEAWRSKEVFVAHFHATYEEFPNLPIWAAAEIMSFGSMLTLFNMSPLRTQKAIAHRYHVTRPVLASWLLTLNYTRNLCAHHSRLWNRGLSIKPVIPDEKHDARWHAPTAVGTDRVFVVLTLLNHMVKQIAPQTRWRQRLFDLFDRFPEMPLAPMGVPEDWRNHALWR